jgi:uracil-DNA glycosylase family 4
MFNVSCRSNNCIKDRFSVLKDIEDRIKTCLQCSLGKQRKKPLSGIFIEPTDVLLVDHMPNETEDKSGCLLPDSRLKSLTKLLALVKPTLDITKVSYTNVCKCFGTDLNSKSCLLYLDAQIAALDPILIIVWGNDATKKMTGRDDLELGVPYVTGIKNQYVLFPMMHPRTLVAEKDKNLPIWRTQLETLSKIAGQYDLPIFK